MTQHVITHLRRATAGDRSVFELGVPASQPVFACKAANVAYNTAKYHRAQDRQFDEQCLAAMDYAGELLESRAFQRALEGDVEPIVYTGVTVGHIRTFDSRYKSNSSGPTGWDKFKSLAQT